MSAALIEASPVAVDVALAVEPLALAAGMPCGEQSVALAASDMPTAVPLREVSLELAAFWVAQGVERLGGEVACWSISEQDRAANLRAVLTDSVSAADRAQDRRIWGSRRRGDQARGVAMRLSRLLDQQAGYVRQFPTTPVPLPYNEETDERWTIQVPTRDLEMARRLAEGDAR